MGRCHCGLRGFDRAGAPGYAVARMSESAFSECALRLHPADHVAVLRRAVTSGTVIRADDLVMVVAVDIPAGHKIALRHVAEGEPVRKYGQIIGFAACPIKPGDHVHTHNLVMREFERDYQIGTEVRKPGSPRPEEQRHFLGFARADGSAGTRNYLAVISNVNCSASVSRSVADRFRGTALRNDFPNVDGVIALTHKGGCGMDPGEPLHVLQRVLAGMSRHPNIGGCVLIGLGCEANQLQDLVRQHRLAESAAGELTPTVLEIQALGGVRHTVESGVKAVLGLLPRVNAARRTSQPLNRLVLAENCGGSDANSGITANPALGVASDALVRHGGTSVLAETPEIYGAEHLLIRRAINREVGGKLLELIRWWEEHVRLHRSTIDNNPSVGNKAGGLSTIYEKSLGAIAKGGQSPLVAVYRYAERVTASGFCFMDTPGYDPVSMTGLVAGGCNIAVFTTGRGSVFGCKPTPTIKVATNTPLFRHMEDDMDLDAGTILEGGETVEQVGQRIFEKIIAVASGEKTKSELAGMGDEEFAPWLLGPTF
jgi:altronate hydrolase